MKRTYIFRKILISVPSFPSRRILTTHEKCTAHDERLQSLTERRRHHIYEWREHERAKGTVLRARWIHVEVLGLYKLDLSALSYLGAWGAGPRPHDLIVARPFIDSSSKAALSPVHTELRRH